MTESKTPPNPVDLNTPVGLRYHSGFAYVDDSAVSLRALRKALSPHHLVLETYSTAQEILKRSEEIPLVAVLLDVDLGGSVDGVAVSKALRAQYPAIKIAFFTAEAVNARVDALTELGPVFNKHTGLDRVVDWFLSVING